MALGAVLVTIAKPFVVLWAALNAIDDFAFIMRASRLVSVLLPNRRRRQRPQPQPQQQQRGVIVGSISANLDDDLEGALDEDDGGDDRTDLCDVCDDVMSDLLKSDGLSAVPCGWACLKIPSCVKMCERVQETASTSTKFPCVAAGYCHDAADVERYVSATDPDRCDVGPFFRCEPRRFCRRRWSRGMRFTCELRPGIGRWVGLKRSAAEYTVALAEGLLHQKNCGEVGAGPYCIARPTGWGVVAEIVGHVLSLAYGGYRSVVAIETRGGDDDQQWLTFWVILTAVLFVEQYFARTLLSTVPLYYEAKLIVLIWLLYRSGAERIYRRLRRVLLALRLLRSDEEVAEQELSILQQLSRGAVQESLAHLRTDSKKFMRDLTLLGAWEQERWEEPCAVESLYLASRFLLSGEGSSAMERRGVTPDVRADILERAASVVSFQPRFVVVRLYGTWLDGGGGGGNDKGDDGGDVDGGLEGELPPMDRNGLADAYVVCQLVPHVDDVNGSGSDSGSGGGKLVAPYPPKGIRSSIKHGTLRPQWNETLELPLKGGTVGPDGNYRNSSARTTSIRFVVRDADVGRWGYAMRFFRLAIVSMALSTIAAYVWGMTDEWTTDRQRVIHASCAVAFTVFGYAISYVMAVVRRADDEVVGECTVPLQILLDQSERTLLLTLQKSDATTAKETKGELTLVKKEEEEEKERENEEKKERERDGEVDAGGRTMMSTHDKTNSVGGLGIIRVKIWLSED